MPTIVDPFRDGFSLMSLSDSINILPNMFGRVTALGMFKWKPQLTNLIGIEMKEGVLNLIPTTSWGGVPPKNTVPARKMKGFMIPHTPFEDTVAAADVIGVRAFGQQNAFETVIGRVNDKLQEMKNKTDITHEFRYMSALKGEVRDADNTTVIYNYFDEFGVTQQVFDFAFSDVNFDVRSKCVAINRWIELNLRGEVKTTTRALVSPEFLDQLIKHKSVTQTWLGWYAAADRMGGDPRSGFNFGGIIFEEYNASIGNIRFIDAGEGHVFPEGTQQTFADFGAPADFVETVNTLALPYYARQKNQDFNRGVDIHTQSNRLPMVLRPAVVPKIRAV